MAEKPNLIVALSIPKCGTNLFRQFQFNCLAMANGEGPQTYDDMARRCPSQLPDHIRNGWQYTPADPALKLIGYDAFTYGHYATNIMKVIDETDGPMFCLYRNPLDFFVSAYYYFKAGRMRVPTGEPFDLVADYLPRFAAAYKRYHLTAKRWPDRVRLVAYEDLMERPVDTMTSAWEGFGSPFSHDIISRASQASSFRAARAFEDKVGYLHMNGRERDERHLDVLKKTRFVRSGKIGQWRDYFTSTQIAAIRDGLKAQRINLDNFQTLPTSDLR